MNRLLLGAAILAAPLTVSEQNLGENVERLNSADPCRMVVAPVYSDAGEHEYVGYGSTCRSIYRLHGGVRWELAYVNGVRHGIEVPTGTCNKPQDASKNNTLELHRLSQDQKSKGCQRTV